MVNDAKQFFRENATLIYFLIAQFIAGGAAVLSITAYMVRLETRVETLESRGSPHLAEINNRLTTTEKETNSNRERIDRVVDILTRELNKSIPK